MSRKVSLWFVASFSWDWLIGNSINRVKMGKKTSKNKIKHHPKVKAFYKSIRTRRRTRDLDQIQDDIAKQQENPTLADRPVDLELPGLGQHYCIQCARHFIDQHTLDEHTKSKVHKKRLVSKQSIKYQCSFTSLNWVGALVVRQWRASNLSRRYLAKSSFYALNQWINQSISHYFSVSCRSHCPHSIISLNWVGVLVVRHWRTSNLSRQDPFSHISSN